MSDPLLSIIVVSYNTREMTLACLQSIKDQTTIPYEILVVDNNSPDGSAEAVAENHPDVRLFAEKDNHGFAGGNNLAAKSARGEYILLLNPDTVVLDGALDKLIAFAGRTPDARIWGGRTLFGDMSLNRKSCFGRVTLWSLFCRAFGLSIIFRKSEFFNPEEFGEWDCMSERQVDIVSGCFLLLKRADWETLNGFDPVFFMYGEEADLCLRSIRDLGSKPRVTPDAVIIHYHGGSTSNRFTEKTIRLLKARTELIRRHFPSYQQPLARLLVSCQPFIRYVKHRLLGGAEVWAEVWKQRKEWKDGF